MNRFKNIHYSYKTNILFSKVIYNLDEYFLKIRDGNVTYFETNIFIMFLEGWIRLSN